MSNPFVPRIGGVLSADIAVPEHEREMRFYSRVLGTGERPFWREDLLNNQGLPVIGLGARSPEYADLPLQWMPHIQVADVAASVQHALALGGAELMHGKDDDGASQWAVLRDPNGAVFGIIPVVSEDEIPLAAEESADPSSVGRIAWLDLTVHAASAARDFYRQVVGWSVQDVEMEDADERYADYDMCGDDGEPVAGVCHASDANQGLPPVWMLYLPVGDLTESLRIVEEEGGRVIHSSKAPDGPYPYVVVRDPVGACFGLVPAAPLSGAATRS